MSATASPWKMGSASITALPTITASAVSAIGRNRTSTASSTAAASGIPSRSFSSAKSTRMMLLRTTIPAPAMKPIMLVAVKNVPAERVRRQDADERERDRREDHERHREALEPADHEHVDEQHHRREREAEVAEDLERDVPLAVPLERGATRCPPGARGRSARPARRDPRAAPRASSLEREQRVERALDLAGQVGGDVGHGLQVLVLDLRRPRASPRRVTSSDSGTRPRRARAR